MEPNDQGREGSGGLVLSETERDAERDGERETEAHSTLPR